MNKRVREFYKLVWKNKDNEIKLRDYQLKVAKDIILQDATPFPPTRIAGIDAAYKNDTAYTACVTLEYNSLLVVEQLITKTELEFPYKPGFFVFREGPAILKTYNQLQYEPDVILINAHGISHPLSIGAASHIGLLINKPTIGVAQNLLCGYVNPIKNIGDYSEIIYKKKIVGYAYLSQSGMKPIYISPGHLISLESSLKIVKNLIGNDKLPEPLILAHKLANEYKAKQLI